MHTFLSRALRLPILAAACLLAGPAFAGDYDLRATPDLYAGSGAGAHRAAGSDYWQIAPRLELAIPLSDDGLSSGPKMGVEALYAFGEIAPKLDLDAGGRFSFTYVDPISIFELVPEARLSTPIGPRLKLYGETGLGLALLTGGGDNSLAGVLRFGFGGTYALSNKVNLLVEPLGFNIYLKSGSHTIMNVAIGLQFKS
ncbi:hypothetical protein [Anaeromyxobacter paludicola]|uniref:Outer membrane protein beta-barrel domain-containing protein n=1 Tax=Anaeromyxobacter paludicola TaxID=2918171 RepID=A0ABN6N3P3_9BACT|nr:hypothetical protein [Anaeromyxobacter paludicola]BDG07804.1 hypothetical protein AMPC_09170 [Anaeromyxobacter paludicola]